MEQQKYHFVDFSIGQDLNYLTLKIVFAIITIMIKSSADYFNIFSLAFIEELQQGGITFVNKNCDDFVKNEYPHYRKEYEDEMNILHNWWRKNPIKLLKNKKGLLARLSKDIVDRIVSDKHFRFMILKTFHDSQFSDIVFDKNEKTLLAKIDYDDMFCKTQFGTQITLLFYEIEIYPDGLDKIELFEKKGEAAVVIQSIGYDVKSEKIEFWFDIAHFGEIDDDFWQLKFICEKVEIKGNS